MDQQPQSKSSSKFMMWVILAVVVAIVLVGAWYMMTKDKISTNTNQQVNTNTAVATVYSSSALGFQTTLPATWTTVDSNGFKADIVFQSPKAKDCGCVVYVTRESNNDGLTVESWLVSAQTKKDSYMSQVEYDRRRMSNSSSESELAGTYAQTTTTLGGKTGVLQNHQYDGGGYVRYLIPIEKSIYAVTLWSDSHYFANENEQNQQDGGKLQQEVNQITESFTFI